MMIKVNGKIKLINQYKMLACNYVAYAILNLSKSLMRCKRADWNNHLEWANDTKK